MAGQRFFDKKNTRTNHALSFLFPLPISIQIISGLVVKMQLKPNKPEYAKQKSKEKRHPQPCRGAGRDM